jgi:hypothetical protein
MEFQAFFVSHNRRRRFGSVNPELRLEVSRSSIVEILIDVGLAGPITVVS